jgi:hypothetical protein
MRRSHLERNGLMRGRRRVRSVDRSSLEAMSDRVEIVRVSQVVLGRSVLIHRARLRVERDRLRSGLTRRGRLKAVNGRMRRSRMRRGQARVANGPFQRSLIRHGRLRVVRGHRSSRVALKEKSVVLSQVVSGRSGLMRRVRLRVELSHLQNGPILRGRVRAASDRLRSVRTRRALRRVARRSPAWSGHCRSGRTSLGRRTLISAHSPRNRGFRRRRARERRGRINLVQRAAFLAQAQAHGRVLEASRELSLEASRSLEGSQEGSAQSGAGLPMALSQRRARSPGQRSR